MAEEIKPVEKPGINPEINPVEMSMAAEINPVENPVDYKPWLDAVWRNDWCKAKEFLTQHPSAITATDSDGDTALHNAIYKGHEQIVEELVQLMTEEQLETKNDDGETALTFAAAKNLKIVKCLVAKNKKLLGIADVDQMTPILIAAKNDRWDIVEELVQLMTEEQLETKNDDGETALTIAAAKNLKIVKCLVAKNKKLLGIADGYGRTPIVIAANKDRWDIVEELVQLMTEEQLEIQDVVGQTALTIAAATNIEMVKCLVAKNKKLLGIAKYSSKMTPILIAAENHRRDIVRYLYSLTPLEDLKPDKGSWGSELVICCLRAKQFDIVLELLDRCPGLGCAKGFESYPIYEFAFLPSAFPSGTSLKCWQRWIYKCIHVEYARSVSDVRINVQNQENGQGDQRNSTSQTSVYYKDFHRGFQSLWESTAFVI
ncbi:hypothetical protein C1H46_011381 [Malus baccata]|uniref:Uncharacterized protein n=1 Tax=Malus baccata TaxID=106549 RepID=A0A540MW44_MALBA|nr:hypothetical protein C1H46_011381 [Malus baccata]